MTMSLSMTARATAPTMASPGTACPRRVEKYTYNGENQLIEALSETIRFCREDNSIWNTAEVGK